MAELDYAYLAEFAKVESNKLTAIGASFTESQPTEYPFVHPIAVAGRIRCPIGTDSVGLEVRFSTPGEGVSVTVSGELSPTSSTQQYRDRVGLLFSLVQPVVIAEPGLCEVFISLDGEQVRRLAFESLPLA